LTVLFIVYTFKEMAVSYDPAKREWMLRERGLDFEDAEIVFAGLTIDIADRRHDYGEPRINTVGHLRGRMAIVCWTPRGGVRHVISMRKINDREKARYQKRFEES
jgi:uncharacterized DUF497 family protein